MDPTGQELQGFPPPAGYWEIFLYPFFSVDSGSEFWEVFISLLFTRATWGKATGEDAFPGGESSDVTACFLLVQVSQRVARLGNWAI